LSRLAANARVVWALGRRSVRQTFRRPQLVAPILIFPTLLLAVQTGGAVGALDLPGFPEVKGFLDFMLAGAMLQACLLAGNSGGVALAVDLEMGFADRLFAAPISRYSIVLGRLAGTGALGAAAAIWFIGIGLAFGVEFDQGLVGIALMVLFIAASAVVFGALSSAIALYTGQSSVVQGLFPLVFVILFLSSAFFPAHLMLEPAATIAEYNPISFVTDGVRDQVIGGVDLEVLVETVAAIGLIGAVSFALSALALRRRLRVG
jgi:ABC-2 type transport system permease protein